MPTVGRSRPVRGPSARALAFAVVISALVLASWSLVHHDLACHLKSRTPCASCSAGTSAPGLVAERQTVAADYTVRRSVHPARATRLAIRPSDTTAGRAPPA